eukprot:gene3399-3878_t
MRNWTATQFDEQGFQARGIDGLYDLLYDPSESANLLRSQWAKRPLSALHPDITPGSTGDVVPYGQAVRLQASLVEWLNSTQSAYALPVSRRVLDTTPINQAPLLQKQPAPVKVTAMQQFTVPLQEGTFLDIDGDVLKYTALLDRVSLPPWASVDSKTGQLSGAVPSTGTHLVRIVASDTGQGFIERLGIATVCGVSPVRPPGQQ